jgi:hypothetical protein
MCPLRPPQVEEDIVHRAEGADQRAERREKQRERQARHIAVQEAALLCGGPSGRGTRTRKIVDYTWVIRFYAVVVSFLLRRFETLFFASIHFPSFVLRSAVYFCCFVCTSLCSNWLMAQQCNTINSPTCRHCHERIIQWLSCNPLFHVEPDGWI